MNFLSLSSGDPICTDLFLSVSNNNCVISLTYMTIIVQCCLTNTNNIHKIKYTRNERVMIDMTALLPDLVGHPRDQRSRIKILTPEMDVFIGWDQSTWFPVILFF